MSAKEQLLNEIENAPDAMVKEILGFSLLLKQRQQDQQPKRRKSFGHFLKLSSSSCALTGGILLASNTPSSGYGFIFLALSSGQLLLASLQERDRTMILYAASLFIFVDCLGVYRWVLS
jgi:hypothetical protein